MLIQKNFPRIAFEWLNILPQLGLKEYYLSTDTGARNLSTTPRANKCRNMNPKRGETMHLTMIV
jgi:hypothetical protein